MNLEFNPWDSEQERHYGSTRRLLSLANDFGYKFDRPSDAENQRKIFESYDSIKILSLMSNISTVEDHLQRINRETGKILLDKETHDLTSLTRLESRLSQLGALSSHLGEIVVNKGVITSRLQQPYNGANLLIDASLHKNVIEFFSLITPLLSDLNTLLDAITWTATNSGEFTEKTDKVMMRIHTSLDLLESNIDRLTKLRSTINSLTG